MSEELRAIGYLCPECGNPVQAVRDAFSLTASDAAIICTCGRSALHTRFDGTRFRVEVPCGLCGGVHTADCPADRMLRGATALACSKSGQFACFIGPEGVVEQRLGELRALADRLHRQEGDQPDTAFLNDVIMYEVLSELKDIAARPDGITCRCGSRQYGMEIRPAAVDLVCRACGAKLRVGAASDRDLDDLCCQLKLVIPGR